MKWEEKICSCNRCYSDKTPLIFPFSGQRIVFMSESPWDFPQKDETVKDFKEKTLPYCISKCTKKHIRVPYNIFEFLIQTFKVNRSNIPEFFKTIYWTHIAKRTLKYKSEEQKRKCAHMCLSSTNRELEKINMELLVIATHIGVDLLFNTTYTRAFEKQAEKLERTEELLTNRELGYMALHKKFKVAVFPNPSPINSNYKKIAYIENKDITEKILEKIYAYLPPILTKSRNVKLTDFGEKNKFD